MKYIYIIITLLLASTTQAQDTLTLFQEEVEMGGYGAQHYTFPLEEGDQMVYSFIKVSHRPVKSIEIREMNRHDLILKYKRPYNVINKSIDIEETGDYSFHFKNRGLFGRKVAFTLKRIPEPEVKPDTIRHIVYKDSIVYDTIHSTKTIATTYYDTIPEEILNTELTIGATKDLINKNRQCIDIPLPENSSNYYWAYWIGFNTEDNKNYEELSAKPSPKWLAKEIADPLTAYGIGLQYTLPSSSTDGFNFYFISGEGQKNAFIASKNIPPQKQRNYGRIPAWEYPNQQLYACFHNNNPISNLKVNLKIVGYKIVPHTEETEIEKLTIVESIIKVQVGERIHLIMPKSL